MIAIDKRAADFYEKNPPVRVNAVDLPKGGIDLGLFDTTARSLTMIAPLSAHRWPLTAASESDNGNR